MSRYFDRRRFLQSCSLTSATLATGIASLDAEAAQPIVRNGTSKFKFSLAAYSYRKLLQGKQAELTLADFIDDCAQNATRGHRAYVVLLS